MGRLSGYSNRIKITTKSTKVESDLIDFPLGLTLSSGCGIYSQDMTAIFDEVGNDYTKIAITSYDGETILPAEVEYWNEEVKEAQLWFKAPNVYSAAETDFYLYYDATASGNALIDTNEDAITYQVSVSIGSEGTYDTVGAYTPFVLKENEVYKMWYSGKESTNWRTLYCTSTDGINWSNFQMVVDKGSEGTYDTINADMPFVLKDGGVYKMWYSGYNGTNYRIIYCTSTDGINWSNFQMVIDIGSEGTYDTTRCTAPVVVKEDELYKMWYTGYNGTNYRIIYTSSPTPEWKTATQSVWDSSYKAVYHMNNNPSGGAGCIKDSTSNKNHGTSGGSMTSDDLINGRAIEFDGTDDYIQLPRINLYGDPTIMMYNSPNILRASVLLSEYDTSYDEWGNGTFNGNSVEWKDSHSNGSDYFTVEDYTRPLNEWSLVTFKKSSTLAYFFIFDQLVKIGTTGNINGPDSIYRICFADTSGNRLFFKGLVGEIHISDTERSSSWIKAISYVITDSLLYFTEDQIPYDYIFRGIIKEKGMPAQRKVMLYRRSSGELINSMTSAADGFYYLTTPYNEEHYIVVLDNDSGDEYNALIQDRVYPSLA